MDDVKNFANHMREDLPVPYDAMPDIALYMDQVLAFLSRKKVSSREGEELTSAMVNNYIKDGLVPRAHGKKYGPEHLVYLTLVARLKQVLSVRDMAILLQNGIVDGEEENYYTRFREKLDKAFETIAEPDADENSSLEDLALEFALQSYVNKVVCEHLIDTIAKEKGIILPDKKRKAKK